MTEYTALMYLDHTERLSAVASQPVCFHFADASRHYPDFFALHESGEKVMYDVRPLALVDKTAEEQFAKTSEACERIGWGYAVLHGVSGGSTLQPGVGGRVPPSLELADCWGPRAAAGLPRCTPDIR